MNDKTLTGWPYEDDRYDSRQADELAQRHYFETRDQAFFQALVTLTHLALTDAGGANDETEERRGIAVAEASDNLLRFYNEAANADLRVTVLMAAVVSEHLTNTRGAL